MSNIIDFAEAQRRLQWCTELDSYGFNGAQELLDRRINLDDWAAVKLALHNPYPGDPTFSRMLAHRCVRLAKEWAGEPKGAA